MQNREASGVSTWLLALGYRTSALQLGGRVSNNLPLMSLATTFLMTDGKMWQGSSRAR